MTWVWPLCPTWWRLNQTNSHSSDFHIQLQPTHRPSDPAESREHAALITCITSCLMASNWQQHIRRQEESQSKEVSSSVTTFSALLNQDSRKNTLFLSKDGALNHLPKTYLFNVPITSQYHTEKQVARNLWPFGRQTIEQSKVVNSSRWVYLIQYYTDNIYLSQMQKNIQNKV